jgi:hypothetical protein
MHIACLLAAQQIILAPIFDSSCDCPNDDITAAASCCLLYRLPGCGVQYVDEDETLIKFAMACRRNGQRMGLGAKKPRTGSVKPRGGR